MIIDFSKSVAAGKVAAEETRKLAAELALASVNDTWTTEHTMRSVQGLSVAAAYMLQIIGVLEAVNGQMQEMFGEKPPNPGQSAGEEPPAGAVPPAAGLGAQLIGQLLKVAADAQKAEREARRPPRPGFRIPPKGKRR
jgi:hypothetical protein